MTFDQFLAQRLFAPLGMTDTTFYLSAAQRARLARGYVKSKESGALEPAPARAEYDGSRERPPHGNGGLYSTAPDYARFCQMLLNGGTLEDRRYLTAAAMKLLSTPQTGNPPTGSFQNATYWHRGPNAARGIRNGVPCS